MTASADGRPAARLVLACCMFPAAALPGCAPGMIVAHEEIVRGNAEAGDRREASNTCSALSVFLSWNQDDLALMFGYWLPGEEVPEVEFGERLVVLSYTRGCRYWDNDLVVEEVRFLDDDPQYDGRLLVSETIQSVGVGEGESTWRPYNLSYVDLPVQPYSVEADITVLPLAEY